MSVSFRVKILEQFVDTVNQLKAQRHHTVHMHICAALCSLLQVLPCNCTEASALFLRWSLTPEHCVSCSASGFCSGLPGPGGGARPPAGPAGSGPGEQQSSDALRGCRGSGPAGPGGQGPWFQRLRLAALLRQVKY